MSRIKEEGKGETESMKKEAENRPMMEGGKKKNKEERDKLQKKENIRKVKKER